MPTKPRVLEFDVSVDRDRTARSFRGGSPIPLEDAWSAEHLVLAALVRCTLTSLDYHLRRAGLTASGSGQAHGVVTRRDADGLYGFVEIEARYDIELEHVPEQEIVAELVEKAERGCFVGNSLTPRPRYRWTVNGEEHT
ncbi:MAG: OsmC family protein [Actinobacteria bacterium]|nr:OsmC family protein [Actinomycetota bacterium]